MKFNNSVFLHKDKVYKESQQLNFITISQLSYFASNIGEHVMINFEILI